MSEFSKKREDIFHAHLWYKKNGDGIIKTDNGPDLNSVGGDIKSGDSLTYNNVNFKDGSLNTLLITIAALDKDKDKKIEVRLDSIDGELLGSLSIEPSNKVRVFKDHYLRIPKVNGIHDVVFLFKDDMNIDINIFNFSEYDGTETKEAFDERMKWWRDCKYGQFIHFGPYAEAGGEYKGQWVQYAEWIMWFLNIPREDYERDIAKKFNPYEFNAEEIVKVIKDGGQKYLAITSRHHDGFSMYDTEVRGFRDYKLLGYADYTGPDPLEEISKECRKQGVKFGAYYTIYEWHDPTQENRGEYIYPEQKEEYKTRLKAQLRELIERYDIELLWCDGEWIEWWTKEDGREMYRYLRTLKPSLIINNRVGKKDPDDGDYGTPEQEIPATGLDYDWESCMTLNKSWGYHKADNNWKTPKEVVDQLIDIVSKGGIYFLNMGIDGLGKVPEESAKILREVGAWLNENGETIYETRRTCFTKLPNKVKATTKEGKIYLHFIQWGGGESIKIPSIVNEIKNMKVFGSNINVNYTQLKDEILIETPKIEGNKYDTIIEIDVEGIPKQVENYMDSEDENKKVKATLELISPKGEENTRSTDKIEFIGKATGGELVTILIKTNNTSPIKFEGKVLSDGTWNIGITDMSAGKKIVSISLQDSDGNILDVIEKPFIFKR